MEPSVKKTEANHTGRETDGSSVSSEQPSARMVAHQTRQNVDDAAGETRYSRVRGRQIIPRAHAMPKQGLQGTRPIARYRFLGGTKS